MQAPWCPPMFRQSEPPIGNNREVKKLDIAQALARNLTDAMKDADLSAKDLAGRSGVGAASISEYKNLETAPGIDTLNELAHALNMPAWLLLIDPNATLEETIALLVKRKWNR